MIQRTEVTEIEDGARLKMRGGVFVTVWIGPDDDKARMTINAPGLEGQSFRFSKAQTAALRAVFTGTDQQDAA